MKKNVTITHNTQIYRELCVTFVFLPRSEALIMKVKRVTTRLTCPRFVRRPLRIRSTAVENNCDLRRTIQDSMGD